MQFETRDEQRSPSGAYGKGGSRMFEVGWIARRGGLIVWYSSVSVGVEEESWKWGGEKAKGANRCVVDEKRQVKRWPRRLKELLHYEAKEGWEKEMVHRSCSTKNIKGNRAAVWFISHLLHSLDSQEKGKRPARRSLQRSWPLCGSEQWPPSRGLALHSWGALIKEHNIMGCWLKKKKNKAAQFIGFYEWLNPIMEQFAS